STVVQLGRVDSAGAGYLGDLMAEATGAGPRPLFGRISMANLLAAQAIALAVGVLCLLIGLVPLYTLPIALAALLIPLVPIAQRTLLDWVVTFWRSEEHTSELQSREKLVCRLLLEKKKKKKQM